MDVFLEALRAYQSFNPAGWVAIYRVMPTWAGLVTLLVGLALLLFGGDTRLFRFMAGPLGLLLGVMWTGLLLTRFGFHNPDPRTPAAAAAVLMLVGFLFPPVIVCLAVGIPLGLLGGEIAGAGDFLVGFAPGMLMGGVAAALLHRQVSAVIASLLGAWLLIIGSMAALHQFSGLVVAMALQPWGIVLAALLFAVAGSIYQLSVRPSPEEAERQHSERERLKARMAEEKALEKRWSK